MAYQDVSERSRKPSPDNTFFIFPWRRERGAVPKSSLTPSTSAPAPAPTPHSTPPHFLFSFLLFPLGILTSGFASKDHTIKPGCKTDEFVINGRCRPPCSLMYREVTAGHTVRLLFQLPNRGFELTLVSAWMCS